MVLQCLQPNCLFKAWSFSCRQIATQTNLMLLAGYETTANALAFCIYLLGKHPHAQQKLLQEVDAFKVQPIFFVVTAPATVKIVIISNCP